MPIPFLEERALSRLPGQTNTIYQGVKAVTAIKHGNKHKSIFRHLEDVTTRKRVRDLKRIARDNSYLQYVNKAVKGLY